MEITVKMTSDEFLEFIEWRKNREAYEREVNEVCDKLEELAEKVLDTIKACDETDAPEFKIKSREAAEDLVAAAEKIFE